MARIEMKLWILVALVIVCTFQTQQIYGKEPIKIGVLNVDSGNYADWGFLQKCGFLMAVEDYNNEVLGRPIVLVQADTESNPDVAGRRARRMVEVDGCKFLIGAATTSEALAVGAVAQEKKVLYIGANQNGNEITASHARRNVFLAGPTFSMAVPAAAPTVANMLGKKWFFVTHDYAAGISATQSVKEYLRIINGQDMGEFKVPFGTRDFSSQLLQARNSGADVMVVSVWGADNVALLRQLAEFKIYDKMKVWYTLLNYVDLWSIRPEERLPYVTTEMYYKITPEMAKFNERFQKKFPKAPSPVVDTDTWNGWLAMKILLEGIKRAGTADDVEKVICAMEGMTIKDNLRSTPSYVRPWDHQVVTEVAFVKSNPTAKGTDIWEVIKTIPLETFGPMQDEKKIDISCNPNPKYKK